MKKSLIKLSTLLLLSNLSWNSFQTPYTFAQTVNNEATLNENMSQLRIGLLNALDQIRNDYPEIIITSLDIHRHQLTDKYVYRLSGSSATYEYQWIFYDGLTYTSQRPLPKHLQATIIEMLVNNEDYIEDKVNIDKITNLVKHQYRQGRISDWHFSDLRYEYQDHGIYPIRNSANTQPTTVPTNLKDDYAFWFIDIPTSQGLIRVQVDAKNGNISQYSSNRLYDIDILTQRKNYYLQFYPQELVKNYNDSSVESIFESFVNDQSHSDSYEAMTQESNTPEEIKSHHQPLEIFTSEESQTTDNTESSNSSTNLEESTLPETETSNN